ncbi:MAG: hypothetical protein J7M40_02050, partial [Planctomycetes bacterium]|nr:hypothetical protein [Planctomycetota bacterium]
MYSFLVYATNNHQSPEQVLNKSARITKDIMPSLGQNILSSLRMIPEINGGWFHLYPDNISGEPHVTEFADDNVAVIVFGDIISHNANTVAQHISDIWRRDGIDAVRNLDGCFSAVIVDRSQKSLY